MKIQPIILSLALAFPLTMMGQSSANHSNNMSSKNWSSKASSQLSSSDHQFLRKIGQEDQSEINLANLALSKSSNPKVQDYARSKILAADPSMKREAENIAQRDNATLPNTANSMEQQEYQKLSKLSGSQFDKAYMKYEASEQEKDLGMVRHEINGTNNNQVKDFAQKEETPVRSASQSAQKVASALGVQGTQTASSKKY